MRRYILLVCFSMVLLLQNIAFATTNTGFAERKDVQNFIHLMVTKHHFKKQQLVTLFNQVKFVPQVMKHMNRPLEKETWGMYQLLFVNEWSIKHGARFWNKYQDALNRAEKTYGVPPGIIVATIGVETKYGTHVGGYRVIDALSNIGFSPSSRAPFFRSELEQFLLLTREQHLDPLKVMGSYAGAIGQPQFMPSSYRTYAVNFSKSGKTDLMNNEIDVIGSIANYYKQHGWTTNEPVAIPASFLGGEYNPIMANYNPKQSYTIDQLAKYGILPKEKFAQYDLKVKIIELQSNHYSKEYWLGFPNFDVIKRYNASDLYALAVYQLSSYITALRNKEEAQNG